MYGEKPELQILNCSTCGEPSLLWIDREDMERSKLGLSVERAFATRGNQTYLTYVERGFLTRGYCRACQKALSLRASNAPAPCQRCGYCLQSGQVCCLPYIDAPVEIDERFHYVEKIRGPGLISAWQDALEEELLRDPADRAMRGADQPINPALTSSFPLLQ
jgi:hypothetical protein